MNINNKEYNDTTIDKLEILKTKNKYDKEDIKILEELSKAKNPEIRSEVAETIAGQNDFEVNRIFLDLLNDEDELVRINACDSAYNCQSTEIIDKLKTIILNDKYLVRGYAILSISDIANKYKHEKEIAKFLETIIKVEKSRWVKNTIYRSLYLLKKQNNYLKLLLDNIDDYNYKYRCMVLNCLSDIINKDNTLIIKEKLENRIKIENSNAVISSIKKLLKKCKIYEKIV